ncbi:hypothetical protein BD626DRAFT_515935 [Schizophyllum amplum]|uniref:DUF6697 domain-containing protein n=1 Tax=Schizophyllum amplum TaxID=97359 RepID=A0A550BX78_9AGAR|nr:hypothetical protein BD626DRAFT_515935 [Auriculariopsis ampla]
MEFKSPAAFSPSSLAYEPTIQSPTPPADGPTITVQEYQRLTSGQDSYCSGPLASSNVLLNVDLALEVQVERARTQEALNARDALVLRLSDAYTHLQVKTAEIERLQDTVTRLLPPSPTESNAITSKIAAERQQLADLQNTIQTLQDEIQKLKQEQEKREKPPPKYEARLPLAPPAPPIRRHSGSALSSGSATTLLGCADDPKVDGNLPPQVEFNSEDPQIIIAARNKLLASLQLPPEAPEDSLHPILLPPSMTLHEFISSLTPVVRTSLVNYRVLYESTTAWCPEREEHGYFLSPVFKCSTSPRTATVHRWTQTDPLARLNKPTEFFFHKDGSWYYAGTYNAFRFPDLSIREWNELSDEATQTIAKETLAARKNTSPQHFFEVKELYGAGALRVACVGLHCIGFNKTMHRALLEQVKVCRAGRWSRPATAMGGGGVWNSAAGDLVSTFEKLRMADSVADGQENAPVKR